MPEDMLRWIYIKMQPTTNNKHNDSPYLNMKIVVQKKTLVSCFTDTEEKQMMGVRKFHLCLYFARLPKSHPRPTSLFD